MKKSLLKTWFINFAESMSAMKKMYWNIDKEWRPCFNQPASCYFSVKSTDKIYQSTQVHTMNLVLEFYVKCFYVNRVMTCVWKSLAIMTECYIISVFIHFKVLQVDIYLHRTTSTCTCSHLKIHILFDHSHGRNGLW